MEKAEFQKKLAKINKIASKFKWTYVSNDMNNYRVSFKDELSIYRARTGYYRNNSSVHGQEGVQLIIKKSIYDNSNMTLVFSWQLQY